MNCIKFCGVIDVLFDRSDSCKEMSYAWQWRDRPCRGMSDTHWTLVVSVLCESDTIHSVAGYAHCTIISLCHYFTGSCLILYTFCCDLHELLGHILGCITARDAESSFFCWTVTPTSGFKKLGLWLQLQPLKISRRQLRVKVKHRLLNLCDCDNVLSEWCRQTSSQDLKKIIP